MNVQRTKRLQELYHSLNVQEKLDSRPILLVQKNLQKTMTKTLSKNGFYLLQRELNYLVERETNKIKQRSKMIERKQQSELKSKLNIYARNRYHFLTDKIIKIGKRQPQPLKNIVKINSNKFLISKQFNARISQKIDAIFQHQRIQEIKSSKIEHLQKKNPTPLVNELSKNKQLFHRKTQSTHNLGKSERLSDLTLRKKRNSIQTLTYRHNLIEKSQFKHELFHTKDDGQIVNFQRNYVFNSENQDFEKENEINSLCESNHKTEKSKIFVRWGQNEKNNQNGLQMQKKRLKKTVIVKQ